jgi:hypothetical protein
MLKGETPAQHQAFLKSRTSSQTTTQAPVKTAQPDTGTKLQQMTAARKDLGSTGNMLKARADAAAARSNDLGSTGNMLKARANAATVKPVGQLGAERSSVTQTTGTPASTAQPLGAVQGPQTQQSADQRAALSAALRGLSMKDRTNGQTLFRTVPGTTQAIPARSGNWNYPPNSPLRK